MPIIETVRSKCRDCYRCVRACPVKAIKVERGSQLAEFHATVVDERCVHCGTCMRECPQGAKRARVDLDAAKALIKHGPAAASVAPSFAGVYPGDPLRVVGALRSLGFTVVQETALGAEMVAAAHQRLFHEGKGPFIGSSCPSLVSLVEKYHPEALKYLAPLVSPAIAHGKYLKRQHPGIGVVFIGPCVAKKDEISQKQVSGAVDVALTFAELDSWLVSAGIDIETCEPSSFDGPYPSKARTFAAEGGLIHASCQGSPTVSRGVVSQSGSAACIETLLHLPAADVSPELMDLLMCSGGCISGPFADEGPGFQERRQRLIEYRDSAPQGTEVDYSKLLPAGELTRTFKDRKARLKEPSPEEMKSILAKSGKYSPEDELDCGACGYGSCREKAVAVWNGMADPEMCIPFMRQKAESMANLVVSATPNGIIVASMDGTIIDVNRAAERILGKRKKECVGTNIGDHLDPKYYLEAARTMDSAKGVSEVGGLVLDQEVLYVPDQKLLVGFVYDVTEARKQIAHRQAVADEAVARAQSIIDKQMSVAQKIAGLLGETTAETKLSLKSLMTVVREETPSIDEPKD